jgi:hypothetical protein
VLSEPEPELHGQYANVSHDTFNLGGVELNQRIQQALNEAINPQKLISSVPDEIKALNLNIGNVKFLVNDGILAVQIVAFAETSPEIAMKLIEKLQTYKEKN